MCGVFFVGESNNPRKNDKQLFQKKDADPVLVANGEGMSEEEKKENEFQVKLEEAHLWPGA